MKKLVVLLLILLSHAGIYANKKIPQLLAQAGSVSITPPLEMKFALGGYGDRMNKPATSIHDSIFAKAVLFKQGEKKFALITMDLLGLPSNFKQDLLKHLNNKEWQADNIMLLPSHSHGSLEMSCLNSKNNLNIPQIGIFQPELLQFLVEKTAHLIMSTDQAYQPVHLATKTESLEGLNRNRRGEAECDKMLWITRIDHLNGKPMAVLVNWTAHPTFLDEKDMALSAEWPGYLQNYLEKKIGNGVKALYFNGAEGDQSPVWNDPAKNHYQKIQDYGERLGKEAKSLYDQIVPKRDGILNYQYESLVLPNHKAHPNFMKTGGDEYGMTEQSVVVVMNTLCPEHTELQALQIGDLLIAAVPGEMTAILGLSIKNQLKEKGFHNIAIGGLANEWISYILSNHQYRFGQGYESSMSFYGDSLGEFMVGKLVDNAAKMTPVN
ncbi:MAG: neutral/alkaline non-lysosomal ceramidase N-terminal domain-containing protein [Marinilabiliales bacterium]|nr:neutral/alkaline non-lysosomal ceramidase N-terminal domain-containing protein [Marinilabiliales bacterium]